MVKGRAGPKSTSLLTDTPACRRTTAAVLGCEHNSEIQSNKSFSQFMTQPMTLPSWKLGQWCVLEPNSHNVTISTSAEQRLAENTAPEL